MRAVSRPNLFWPLFVALTASAWIALWIWDTSPYSRYLHHVNWPDIPLADALCRAMPGGPVALAALLHAGAWLLMITAMMLPTTVPLLEVFRRLTAHRADRRVLLTLVVLGYVGAWTLFGVGAHGLDATLHQLASRSLWMVMHGWLVGAAMLGLAGVYQFSRFKYRCLDKCRTPLMFVAEHWHGHNERRDSFLLGVRHGAFCVGCCWALMLLMFSVGTGSIGWMLALGAAMAAEKNLPWGRRVGKPLGLALVVWSGVMVAQHLQLG